MRVYYAHCLSIYDTPQEQRDLQIMDDLGWEVYNPNNDECSAGYREKGMDFFFDLLRNGNFDAVVFRAIPDGRIPAGVMKEVNFASNNIGLPIIELPTNLRGRDMNVEQTREYLRLCGHR